MEKRHSHVIPREESHTGNIKMLGTPLGVLEDGGDILAKPRPESSAVLD